MGLIAPVYADRETAGFIYAAYHLPLHTYKEIKHKMIANYIKID